MTEDMHDIISSVDKKTLLRPIIEKINPKNYYHILTVIFSIGAVVIAVLSIYSYRIDEYALNTILLIVNVICFFGLIFLSIFMYKLQAKFIQISEAIRRVENSENILESIGNAHDEFKSEFMKDMFKTTLLTKDINFLNKVAHDIKDTRNKIIARYSELNENERVKDVNVNTALFNNVKMMESINDISENIYSIRHIKNLNISNDDNNRLIDIMDYLGKIPDVNVYQLLNNFNFLTSLITRSVFYEE